MYLSPPESIQGAKTTDLHLKPNVEAALNVLQKHYDKINPVKVGILCINGILYYTVNCQKILGGVYIKEELV